MTRTMAIMYDAAREATMTDHIAIRRITRLGLALGAGLAVVSIAGVARADPPEGHGYRKTEQHRLQGHPYQQQRWRQAQHYDDRYRRPDMYYTAPPPVYIPPGYYQPQGQTVIFSIPFLN